MASFNQIMADRNKLEELNAALQQSEKDYEKTAQKATEAGYPVVKNTKAEQIKTAIKRIETSAYDTF